MKKVLLPVLFASAGLMLLTGCKDSPSDVTKKYVKACKESDEVTARKYVSGKEMEADAAKQAAENTGFRNLKNAKFGNVVFTDVDKATVEMTYEVTQKVELKKTNGQWKVEKAGWMDEVK